VGRLPRLLLAFVAKLGMWIEKCVSQDLPVGADKDRHRYASATPACCTQANYRRSRHPVRYVESQDASANGASVSQYVVLRQKQRTAEGARDGLSTGAKNATVNRELAALRRVFHLGKKNGKVGFMPTIELTKENNVRKGFLEHEQYRALRARLPDYLRPVLAAMYYTGMRIGEVFSIRWTQVDIVEKEIRLEPGATKND
jgi:integrase